MKIVFMGTPDFSVGTLEEIINAGHEVVGVVTQPDKPKGRGGKMQATPVKEVALRHKLPVYQPIKVKAEAFVAELKAMNPDVIVVVAFGQIISQEILDLPKYGCINVHASLLPKYRGAAPIQWAIINGEEKTGVTIMQMDAGIDTGDMIDKIEITLSEDETGGSLFDKLSQSGAKLLTKVLGDIESGTIIRTPQPQISPTPYAKMIKKQMGKIDFNEEAIAIERLIRGLSPWPSAYTSIAGKTLKLWQAIVDSEDINNEDTNNKDTNHQVGTITKIDKQAIWVQTKKGLLGITELQLEGKKRMNTTDFLRGFELTTTTTLGE